MTFVKYFKPKLVDNVYVCNKAGSDDADRIRNDLISIPFPVLRRSYVTFHHLCGYDEAATDGSVPHNCKITIQKDEHQGEGHTQGSQRLNRSILLTVPESRLSNTGNISKITEWFYEHQPLPRIALNERIVLTAEFDAKSGGFGADNIHFHTPQR